MKIVHTADWHLGKKLQNIDLLSDQAEVLQQFINDLRFEKPDVLIIAGDLYDRAVPAKEAVELLNETLQTIVLDLKIPTLAIAGNHDSASRLHFGSSFMEKQGLYLVGKYEHTYEPVIMTDDYGEVHFHLVPFFDPSILKHELEVGEINSFDEAIKIVTEYQTDQFDYQARHVYIGHIFVTPRGEKEENTSDSERILSVGGAEHVSAQHFKKYDYTALGHLHQAHAVGSDYIRYSGSLMKYSQSEEHHEKGYYIINLQAKGQVNIEKRPLHMAKDIRTIKARLADILAMPKSNDYVFIELQDDVPILSPMAKVRAVFPNCMRVTRSTNPLQTPRQSSQESREKMDDLSLFKAFYKEVMQESPREAEVAIFNEVVQAALKSE